MKIVPRTVRASYILEGVENFGVKCFRGLLPPKRYSAKQFNYAIREWCILTQSSESGWECIARDTKLKFSNNPLMSKLCPGTIKPKVTPVSEGLIKVELSREPCWESPPKGYYFCRKHFNTYYGQYIRYVFGAVKLNRNNPFLKIPALLYTIFYGEEAIKVGTAILLKGFRRFMEQPHLLTSVLYVGINIEVVRGLEVTLSKNTPMSQAPKVSRRVTEIKDALMKGLKEVRKGFVCRVMSYLDMMKSEQYLHEIEEIKAGITSKGFSINNIRTGQDELLRDSITPKNLSEANRALKNAECTAISLSRGFLVLDCVKRVVSLPYEFLRDRLISLEYLR